MLYVIFVVALLVATSIGIVFLGDINSEESDSRLKITIGIFVEIVLIAIAILCFVGIKKLNSSIHSELIEEKVQIYEIYNLDLRISNSNYSYLIKNEDGSLVPCTAPAESKLYPIEGLEQSYIKEYIEYYSQSANTTLFKILLFEDIPEKVEKHTYEIYVPAGIIK